MYAIPSMYKSFHSLVEEPISYVSSVKGRKLESKELSKVTVCVKYVFKEDKENNKVKKMTDDVMEQMTDVLSRLEGRLDSMEKGEMPAGLKEHMDKKGKKEGEEKMEDKMDKGVHAMDDDKRRN